MEVTPRRALDDSSAATSLPGSRCPDMGHLRQGRRRGLQQLPCPSQQRPPAASVAAAKEQGQVLEMHEKLFAHQTALDRPNLEKYAGSSA